MPVAPPVAQDGSPLFDPWRIRAKLDALGLLAPEPPRAPTRSERLLWEALEHRPPGWSREHATGPYRLDFYCPSVRLAVEVDGGSHSGRLAAEKEELRDRWHQLRGIRTRRVTAREVERHLDEVLAWLDADVAAAAGAPPSAIPAASGAAPRTTTAARLPVDVPEDAVRRIERLLEVEALAACRTVLPDLRQARSLLRLLVP